LLIIECKGGRLRKETKILAQPDFSDKDYQKYAVDPIKQANNAFTQILQANPSVFGKVDNIYIMSVSLQAFPKIPKYNEILSELQPELNQNIKVIDYIGLSDLELLAFIINFHDFTVFKFISDKKTLDDYIPYANYYYDKYGLIKRAKYQHEVLAECFKGIHETLFG
jgi:hypothetical protein